MRSRLLTTWRRVARIWRLMTQEQKPQKANKESKSDQLAKRRKEMKTQLENGLSWARLSSL